eukprot:CAMPEP_0117447220 /NCGR_PEP_ID=MMETSP0759-20121206/6758_1 /TAXON_ID=63605 /ORGANISM="Percolomonas cosmopolitus, Strain WS" /LENGTH=672 /DNA_ID=CAMNT_0005239539 /DNA_START=32 /DNA_END=2050 /DNA_ORIENTATION=+
MSSSDKDYRTRFLCQLSKSFPNIASASAEIINLSAIINLPKGTEHFLSDVHGEYEAFSHVIRNASGVIKRKIDDIFPDDILSCQEKNHFAFLIYYPERKLREMKDEEKTNEFYNVLIRRVVKVLRKVALKYTRSKVRKTLPPKYAYIIEELISEKELDTRDGDKSDSREIPRLQREMVENYYQSVIDTIISTGLADEYLTIMCQSIQRLAVDRLHLVGDIYDRGPGAEVIVEELMHHHSVDIQWGNHDIVWMAAAGGHRACIANNIRTSVRYGNQETLEAYGITLDPLAELARKYYGDDPCKNFQPRMPKGTSPEKKQLFAMMQKAMSIIQEKLESQIIDRHPDFQMEHRLMLRNINFDDGTVLVDGKSYKLNDTHFPTVDPANPEALNEDEEEVMQKLVRAHVNSEKMQRHMKFLFDKGTLYLKYNGNLLTHALVPMEQDTNGNLMFSEVTLNGTTYSGEALFKKMDQLARDEFFLGEDKCEVPDVMWYLWCGPKSPLFGKYKMATFERYFLDDKVTHKEENDPYFKRRDQDDPFLAEMVLKEFELDPKNGHVISGHIPVEVKKGEDPVKCGGKLICIDGGFAKAYNTGISGFTLISNSYGLLLTTHTHDFTAEEAIAREEDLHSQMKPLEKASKRQIIRNTDVGKELMEQISDLQELVHAYRSGHLQEKK